MEFKKNYFNVNDEICNYKPVGLNYGIHHKDSNNKFISNKKLIKYDSISGVLYKDDLKFFDSELRKIKVFINFIVIMRKFFLSNRTTKRILLLQKLAFEEIGIGIKSNENIDSLFVYTFFHKSAKIEIYLTVCDTGIITELTCYNLADEIMLRIPLNFEGISYVFEQIFEDFYQFSMNDLDIDNTCIKEKELISRIMQFDTTYNEIDNMNIYDVMNGLLPIDLQDNGAKYKKEVDYILNNDLILNLINSESDSVVINEIFNIVNSKITTPAVAKQFVLEELHAASHGNEKAQEFAKESGFDKVEFADAMSSINSFEEVDGKGEAQQTLLILMMQYISLSDRNKFAEVKVQIVDMIMKKHNLGKYEIPCFQNKRLTLRNYQSDNLFIDLYEDYLILINTYSHKQDKYDRVKGNRFYSKIHGYIELKDTTISRYKKIHSDIETYNILKTEVISERIEFYNIYENERTKEFSYMMKYATEIETLLESIGASGKGMHAKVSSIENFLEREMIRRLRRIATIRNKKMHRKGFNNYVFSDYEDDCKIVVDYLEGKI